MKQRRTSFSIGALDRTTSSDRPNLSAAIATASPTAGSSSRSSSTGHSSRSGRAFGGPFGASVSAEAMTENAAVRGQASVPSCRQRRGCQRGGIFPPCSRVLTGCGCRSHKIRPRGCGSNRQCPLRSRCRRAREPWYRRLLNSTRQGFASHLQGSKGWPVCRSER